MPHQCTNCGRTFADGSKEMLSGCPDCGGNKFQFRPGDDGSGSDAPGDGSTADPPSEPPEPPERPGDSVSRTVGNAAATVRDLVGGSVGADASAAEPPAASGAGSSAVAEADPTPDPEPASSAASDPAGDRGANADPSPADESDDTDFIVAESEPLPKHEDDAQSDARSQIVEPDELPDAADRIPTSSVADGTDEPAEPDAANDATAGSAAAAGEADTRGAADGVDGPDQPAVDDSGPDDRTVADDPDTERADRPDLAELRDELNDQFESIRVVEPGQYELNLMELYDREAYIIALQEDGRYSIQVPDSWREADA